MADENTWFGEQAAEDAPADENVDTTTEAQDDAPADTEVEQGTPPSEVAMPEWVPAEYHDPDKRGELLEKLGVKLSETGEARPEWLPEKFKSPEQLAKSYQDLERKLSGKTQVPETYDLKLPEGTELADEDVAAFKEAGLDNQTAQKVVDYFHNNLVPQLVAERTEQETKDLASKWNMLGSDGAIDNEALSTRVATVKAWADKNVPESVVKELSRSASGVQTLYNLMESGAPTPGAPGAAARSNSMSQDQIDEIVNSDKYWQDESYRERMNKKMVGS